MNLLDIIIGIPLLWFGYKGFNKGFISEITSLAALVTGIWIAVHFSWFVGGYIERELSISNQYISLASFAITFLGVVILMITAGRIATKLASKIALGLLNRLFGALFGFLKVAFIISVLLYLYGRIDPKMKIIPEDTRNESLLFSPIAEMAPLIIPRLEAEQDRFNEAFHSPSAP